MDEKAEMELYDEILKLRTSSDPSIAVMGRARLILLNATRAFIEEEGKRGTKESLVWAAFSLSSIESIISMAYSLTSNDLQTIEILESHRNQLEKLMQDFVLKSGGMTKFGERKGG